MTNCGKGMYYDEKTGKCRKSIQIKRHGIYGKGFESEPQSEQFAKIDKEEKIEGPVTVEHQMAALNSFSHGQGPAHKDFEYAVKLDHEAGHGKEDEKDESLVCPEGYHKVRGYHKGFQGYIAEHCAKNPRRE